MSVLTDNEKRVLCSDEWTLRHSSMLRAEFIAAAKKQIAEMDRKRAHLAAQLAEMEAL